MADLSPQNEIPAIQIKLNYYRQQYEHLLENKNSQFDALKLIQQKIKELETDLERLERK